MLDRVTERVKELVEFPEPDVRILSVPKNASWREITFYVQIQPKAPRLKGANGP